MLCVTRKFSHIWGVTSVVQYSAISNILPSNDETEILIKKDHIERRNKKKLLTW